MLKLLGDVAAHAGRGVAAGVVGTAAMTVSSTIEMKVRGREPSDTPAKAVEKVLGIQPAGAAEEQRLGTLVHWAYGSSWGAVRGVLAWLRIPHPLATVLHFGSVWGAELTVLPRLGVVSPPAEWGAKEVVIDALHHGAYALATGLAWKALSRR